MATATHPYHSEFTDRFKAEGKAEGRAEGKAEALLRLLAGRGVAVGPTARDRILACSDTATLDVWFDRAITATTVDDVFAEHTA